jgi:hypothetical protein
LIREYAIQARKCWLLAYQPFEGLPLDLFMSIERPFGPKRLENPGVEKVELWMSA